MAVSGVSHHHITEYELQYKDSLVPKVKTKMAHGIIHILNDLPDATKRFV